jgi:predicted N-formylglutamate amidohydrolase
LNLLLTCEHATFYIPSEYRSWYAAQRSVLRTHEGIDFGARRLAQQLQRALQAPLFSGEVSRLLVDLNRSIDHPQIFSRFVPKDAALRQDLLTRFYHPYRNAVKEWVQSQTASGFVAHFGIHSFTPDFPGSERKFDLGLLYDPANPFEISLVRAMEKVILMQGAFSLRHNQPYLGAGDGLTTDLRKEFGNPYAGIEVEVNQALVDDKDKMQLLTQLLRKAIAQATAQLGVNSEQV